ncbi:hypothetical protein I4U23_028136 [Adineta vaga]|nr:hypothetical protein I4U23_028136 [Adineta vaga]
MQAIPQRRRPPMMQRPRGYGPPAPAIARGPPPARIAPPPPSTMVHTVILPASTPTYHSARVATIQPTVGYVTIPTVAGPVVVPSTMAPAAMPVATQLPFAASAQPAVQPVAMPGGVRHPGMGRQGPFGNIGRGPVPPGYRRVIARRRR